MRFAGPVSACVPRFRGSPSNHEADNGASTLGVLASISAVLGGQPRRQQGGSKARNMPDA
jgi:hypothetical protein